MKQRRRANMKGAEAGQEGDHRRGRGHEEAMKEMSRRRRGKKKSTEGAEEAEQEEDHRRGRGHEEKTLYLGLKNTTRRRRRGKKKITEGAEEAGQEEGHSRGRGHEEATLSLGLGNTTKERRRAEEAGQGEEHRRGRGHEETTLSLGLLPHDLAVAVLMRLPLLSLVQMRLLATSFNSFLRSPPFPQLPLLISGAGPGMRSPRELIAHCPHLKTWFSLPMIQGHWTLGPSLSAPAPRLTLASSASGGLMCAVVTALRPAAERRRAPPPPQNRVFLLDLYASDYLYDHGKFHLLVFNCFTGASKRLPPPLSDKCYLSRQLCVDMFADACAPGAYYVLLHTPSQLRSDRCSHRDRRVSRPFTDLTLYSSRTGCWMKGHAATAKPYPCTFEDIQKSDLFSYHWDWNTATNEGILFAYAIQSDSWLSIPIIPSEHASCWHFVFKWQGQVFFASSCDFGFKVCMLTSSSQGPNSASWVVVASTPASVSRGLPLGLECLELRFVLCGNLVCMTGCLYMEEGDHRYLQPLVYDLAGAVWFYLPRPCIKGTTTDFGIALLAFQPHLQAMP